MSLLRRRTEWRVERGSCCWRRSRSWRRKWMATWIGYAKQVALSVILLYSEDVQRIKNNRNIITDQTLRMILNFRGSCVGRGEDEQERQTKNHGRWVFFVKLWLFCSEHHLILIFSSSESSSWGKTKSCLWRRRTEGSLWNHVDSEEVQVLGAENVQAAVVVLARHHPRVPQHLHCSCGASQSTRVADWVSM